MQAVLDTGALIAVDRGERRGVVLAKRVVEVEGTFAIPSGCLAQAWRDPRRQVLLGRLLRSRVTRIVALDEVDARQVGVLLRTSGTSDVVDAHVVVVAQRLRFPVVTSDPRDLRRLDSQLKLVVL